MTDDDGSFFALVDWSADDNYHDGAVFGYMGSDFFHPGIEEWGFFSRWEWLEDQATFYFDNNQNRAFYNGTVMSPTGIAARALWAQLGIGTSTTDVNLQSNAGPNRWSGEEWVHKPIIARDPYGAEGVPSERDADIGVYQGRQNMLDRVTFDSENFLHFRYGFVWEWSGETVLL